MVELFSEPRGDKEIERDSEEIRDQFSCEEIKDLNGGVRVEILGRFGHYRMKLREATMAAASEVA